MDKSLKVRIKDRLKADGLIATLSPRRAARFLHWFLTGRLTVATNNASKIAAESNLPTAIKECIMDEILEEYMLSLSVIAQAVSESMGQARVNPSTLQEAHRAAKTYYETKFVKPRFDRILQRFGLDVNKVVPN